MIMLLISNYNIVRIKIIDTDISFFPFNISSKFLLYLECYLLLPKMHKKVSKQIKQSKKYVSITKKSGTSITVIYHAMSLTVLFVHPKNTIVMSLNAEVVVLYFYVSIYFFLHTLKNVTSVNVNLVHFVLADCCVILYILFWLVIKSELCIGW